MSTATPSYRLIFPSVALAAVLSACGGGGGTTPPPAQPKAPIALADTLTVTANQEATLNVLANDSHPDNLALELVSVGAAAHGAAALKNGALVYTPAAGYYGPDKISYTMRAVGGSLSATAEATVAVGMPLRLSGKIGVPAATASTVTITVGTRDFTQAVAADAMYDLPVVLEAPEQMVTVTAQGAGAQSAHIKMISLAGSAASLYGASNGAGRLGGEQLADLNVTLVTTGKYVALRRFNGGRVPANQAEFDAAVMIAPAQEMLQTAGVLRAVIGPVFDQPGVGLPAGVSDTLALVLDTPAYSAFAKVLLQSEPWLVPAATRTVAEDFRSQTVLNVATDRQRNVSLLSADYNVGAFSGTELLVSPNGTATLRFQSASYPAAWTKGSDAFVITPSTPISIYDSSEQAEATINSVTLRQIAGGPNRGLVTMTMTGEAFYAGVGPGRYQKTSLVSAHTWDSLPVLSAQDFSGKTMAGLPDLITPTADPFPSSSPDQMRVAFAADGSASLPDNGNASATWTVQDGKLRIVFADGSVQELARRSANGAAQRWIVRYTKGNQFQLYEALIVQVQAGLSWTSPAQAAQNWRSMAYEDEGIHTQFFVNLLADFTGSESNVNLDGTLAAAAGHTWLIEGNRVVTTVWRLPGGSRAAVCPAGVTCTLHTRRRWTLLRDDGDSIVVLDHLTNPYGDSVRVIGYQRTAR